MTNGLFAALTAVMKHLSKFTHPRPLGCQRQGVLIRGGLRRVA